MAKKRSFAVIGLGRYGMAVLEELVNLDKEVLAIDIDEEMVEMVSDIASHALVIDSTDEDALKNIGIRNIDHVIVAIGDVQASILTSLILKELEIERITVKATTDNHERVLRKIGIEDIIHPEADMGKRIAKRISSSFIYEILELSHHYSLVELHATGKIIGHTLEQLDLRRKFGISVIAIKRQEEVIVPEVDEAIKDQDLLILVGSNHDITRFERLHLKE